jgi:hypothetical protein
VVTEEECRSVMLHLFEQTKKLKEEKLEAERQSQKGLDDLGHDDFRLTSTLTTSDLGGLGGGGMEEVEVSISI